MNKKILISITCCSIFLVQLIAQEKKGDQLYDNLGYLSAAQEYENLKAEEMTFEIKEKLANSYRLNSQFAIAEYWYAQIIQEANDPIILLHYAQMLQSNGKCEDAIRWYQAYQKRNPDDYRGFIENCAEVKEFEQHPKVTVTIENALNSENHDFSPLPFRNGLLFTSMRKPPKSISSRRDQWTDGHYSDLYFIEKKENQFGSPQALEGAINGVYHDGVACYDPIRKELLFTRNTSKGKSTEGVKNLKIYAAKEEDGQWQTPQELSFNDNEYSCSHPTLSADGQRLYFAADFAGGFGGMDIYVVQRQGNRWGIPNNLGPIVNSSGNEIFPFLAQNDKLFYASDGHKGLGALDIFVVEKSNPKDELSWANRKNIGQPFNTTKDDFGFYIDAEETQGYLSSNRNGSANGDDIFQWKQTEKEETDPFDPTPVPPIAPPSILTTDLKTCDKALDIPLPDVKVAIVKTAANWLAYETDASLPDQLIKPSPSGAYSIQVAGGTLRADVSLMTDSSGVFSYFYDPTATYAVFAATNNYAPIYQQYTGWEISQIAGQCIYLQKRNCIPLQGTVEDKKFKSPIAGVDVHLVNLCNGDIISLRSDDIGQFTHCLERDCTYELVATKDGFIEAKKTISTQEQTGSIIEVTIGLELEIKNTSQEPLSDQFINQYFLGEEEANYQEGQVLQLNNIYYDFDQSEIRPDAAYELDYLVALMNNHPSMEIELHAHTDSRGKNDYNQWLSQFRANAAKKFLLKKGIDRNRIHKAKGHGETRLFNHCADGEECTEAEHQKNRRTEVKIIRFDNAFKGITKK